MNPGDIEKIIKIFHKSIDKTILFWYNTDTVKNKGDTDNVQNYKRKFTLFP